MTRDGAEDALRDSEARFRALTGLSSDLYWERDEEFRLTKVVGGRDYDANVALERFVGTRPWEVARTGRASESCSPAWASRRASCR